MNFLVGFPGEFVRFCSFFLGVPTLHVLAVLCDRSTLELEPIRTFNHERNSLRQGAVQAGVNPRASDLLQPTPPKELRKALEIKSLLIVITICLTNHLLLGLPGQLLILAPCASHKSPKHQGCDAIALKQAIYIGFGVVPQLEFSRL